MRRHQQSQRGFTLIEMMVVVAIIAILSGILISIKGSTYGASSQNTAQSLASFYTNCKMRAVSTRRWHRCEVTPTTFTMSQWSATGMTAPTGTCTPPATNCYQLISQTTFDKNIYVSNGTTGLYEPNGGAPVGVTTSVGFVSFPIDFKPDGSAATAGTIFVADGTATKPWRTVVYQATGGSYARRGW